MQQTELHLQPDTDPISWRANDDLCPLQRVRQPVEVLLSSPIDFSAKVFGNCPFKAGHHPPPPPQLTATIANAMIPGPKVSCHLWPDNVLFSSHCVMRFFFYVHVPTCIFVRYVKINEPNWDFATFFCKFCSWALRKGAFVENKTEQFLNALSFIKDTVYG